MNITINTERKDKNEMNVIDNKDGNNLIGIIKDVTKDNDHSEKYEAIYKGDAVWANDDDGYDHQSIGAALDTLMKVYCVGTTYSGQESRSL